MNLLEIVAAVLLTLGSVLLIRALLAADQAFAWPEAPQAESERPEPSLRRAA